VYLGIGTWNSKLINKLMKKSLVLFRIWRPMWCSRYCEW